MNQITERQASILNKTVKEYVELVHPVSSQLIEEKFHFGISPATIRIEMQKLTDGGYLYQPHTSAGRIPTDKGYRFFVDKFFEEGFSDFSDFGQKFFGEIERVEGEMKDSFKFIQQITKRIAEISSALAVSYLAKEKFIFKEGFAQISQEPEFKNSYYFSRFIQMIEAWEENFEDFEPFSDIEVYIGKENPLRKAKDFGVIISTCSFPEEREGFIAIFGPKRMPYEKNISLVKSLTEYLKDFT